MIRRLIKNQEIHRFQQELNHGKTGAFSSGKHFHLLVRSLSAKHERSQYIPYLQPDISHCHTINRIEDSPVFIQQLCLVLCKIADLHIVPQSQLAGIIRNLIHNALHKRGLTFTVLTNESDLFAAVNSKINIMEDNMASIGFGHILTNNRVTPTTATANKFQP